MVKQMYPRLEVNLQALENNAREIISRCHEQGISVSGVIKGTTGLPACAEQFVKGGADMIASSRLEQIEEAKEAGIDKPFMMLRVPMLSEVAEVVRLCDYSLNSELVVLEALNQAAAAQNKVHKVVIMVDLGDLREGFWDKDEMLDVACKVENEMDNLYLAGVGVNVGCYGSVLPTPEKLEELVAIAERVEEKIGRELDIISGGATSTVMRVLDGNVPKRINHMRVGEAILLAVDLPLYYGYDMPYMRDDVYLLKAEVIEVKDKPTHPVGTLGVDAFGNQPVYEDRGIRKRALIGVGKVDYGSYEEIFPQEEGIEILGASSDHTILDVEDMKRPIKVGDVLTFKINYASIVYLTNCRNVQIVYV